MKIYKVRKNKITSYGDEICVKMTVLDFNKILSAVNSATLRANDIGFKSIEREFDELWMELYTCKTMADI